MNLFDALNLIGGISLFLFGMQIMGQSLERRAGDGLRKVLGKLTKSKFSAFLTGLLVTSIIQSSTATTVMVVGFVNSGLLALRQAIYIIMGANIGTTVTAWMLSLTGIQSGNVLMQLLKPSSFSPVLAFIGISFTMFSKNSKKKDSGLILLGFATLMFGMDTMTKSVSGLSEVEEFRNLLIMFESPIFGVVAGALLTAIIHSSSASVGILQALSATGALNLGIAIPIIMGQNIGTTVTAMISSVGTNKNARRASLIHLLFNLIGTFVCLIILYLAKAMFALPFLQDSANVFSIAIVHSIFNVFCTVLLFPTAGFLEKVVCRFIPDKHTEDKVAELDERLLASPTIALERANALTQVLAKTAMDAVRLSFIQLRNYDKERAVSIKELEEKTDHLEDILGTYLVKLSSRQINPKDSEEAAKLLRVLGDFERIGDYALNIEESAFELVDKDIHFSGKAVEELEVMIAANEEILTLAFDAFTKDDLNSALLVEPLEEVIDSLRDKMRVGHIQRLQNGECTVDNGFVWSDLITSLERCADHCSNIAACVLDMSKHELNLHEYVRHIQSTSDDFKKQFDAYSEKYRLN